jgi:hypothetical protein
MKKIIILLSLVTNAYATTYVSPKMKVDVETPNEMEPLVITVLDLITTGLSTDDLYLKFKDTTRFKCTDKTPDEIASEIERSFFKFNIKTDVLGDRVTAHTIGTTITLNSNFEQSELEWSNTIFHEMLHVIGFGHCGKNNPRIYKKILKSVPYLGGDYMQETLSSLGE